MNIKKNYIVVQNLLQKDAIIIHRVRAVSKQQIVTTFHRSGRLLSSSLTLQPEHGTVVTTAKTTVPFRRGELLLLRRIGRWNVVFALRFEF